MKSIASYSFLILGMSLFTLFLSAQSSSDLSDVPVSQQFDEDSLQIAELFRLSLTEGSSYDWLGKMCKTIGPRLSGSTQAEQAVNYSFDLMDSLGLNPKKQPLMVPVWKRGEKELAFYKSANGEKNVLNILALGGSIATVDEGIYAPIVEVETWDDLKTLGEEGVRGKIVFFNEEMNKENLYTFHSYGHCVMHRWGGAVEAAKYGAIGVLVRSLNLRIDDFPHTGSMKYDDGITKIPAAAISTRDAEKLSKLLEEGDEVNVMMRLMCETLEDKESFNVIGEIQGSENPERVILVGGHLDSWDVGDGAHDDGAGVMQSLGVLELLQKLNYKPKNTVRVVFFMNEENGLRGAKAYKDYAETSTEEHIAAIESDRGGFTPRGFHVDGNTSQLEKMMSWESILDKYGIHQIEEGGTGADIGLLKTENNLLIGFVPDSQRYFDHHHSANDTFDTVNKRELELGTASIAALVYLIDQYGL